MSYLTKRNTKIYEMKVNERLSHEEIAEKMDISVPRVSQILRSEFSKRNYRKPTDIAREDIQEIIRMYNGNIHPKIIADKYHVSDRFIRLLLEEAKVYRHKAKPLPKSVNHTVLKNFTPKTQYTLGLLSMTAKLGEPYTIKVSHGKKEVIDLLSTLLSKDSKNKIKVQKLDSPYVLSFNSKHVYNDLQSYGFEESKLPRELLNSSHFWRGVIDSSGEIGMNKLGLPYLRITTNDLFIKNAFILFFRNNVHLGFDFKRNNWDLTITFRDNLPTVVKNLFMDCDKEIRLSRNYERALMIYESQID